jgi:putative ABC transport system ATP-binding protein
MSLIELRGVCRTYRAGAGAVYALRPTELALNSGSFVGVMGQSGSGKSTLLNILGLLDQPSTGDYFLDGNNVTNLDDDARSEIRCRQIGMVFQSFNLFSRLTVLQNVCVPMQYAETPEHIMIQRATELLEEVGLGDRMDHRPTELSGGECQRTAIARALANNPSLILADEPTGNLDEKTGWEIIDLFRKLVDEGKTVLMVTHNPEYRTTVEQNIDLHDGRVTTS